YTRLILSGRLYSTLHDLDRQAQERYELIISQMKAAEGITESIKAMNQMEWVRRMNNIRNRAEEIIRTEMIYT
ncbi:MAG: TnpV protein, partial [Lachnospiraceae bacterium]|nr:TnpV protein [Lachnospiraceae bacterium]